MENKASIDTKTLASYKKPDQIEILQRKGRQLVWTGPQNIIYASFLDQYKEFMLTQRSRRQKKIFTILSKILITRNGDQCRSHHQKMMKTHKNIQKIIAYITRKYENVKKVIDSATQNRETSQMQAPQTNEMEQATVDGAKTWQQGFSPMMYQQRLWDVLDKES